MSKPATRPTRRPSMAPKSPTTSVLVRVWLEPDADSPELDAVRPDSERLGNVRGYARDLRTGDERHFAGTEKLSTFLIERLDG